MISKASLVPQFALLFEMGLRSMKARDDSMNSGIGQLLAYFIMSVSSMQTTRTANSFRTATFSNVQRLRMFRNGCAHSILQ